MKSKQQESWAKTSCRDCSFAITSDEEGSRTVQTGCEAGRLEKFSSVAVNAYDDEREFYIIDSVCNYYCPETSGTSLQEMIEMRKNRFAVIIYADDENWDVRTSVESVINTSYDLSKVVVIIIHRHGCKKAVSESTAAAIKLLQSHKVLSRAVIAANQANMDFESFKYTKGNNFCTRIFAGQTIPVETFQKIDDILNEDLEKYVYFTVNDINIILHRVITLRYLHYNDYLLFEKGAKAEAKSANLYKKLRHA